MKILRQSRIGFVVAVVAGCQATDVGRQTNPHTVQTPSSASASAAAAEGDYAGQRTGYSAPPDTEAENDEPSALEKLGEGTQGVFRRAGQALSPTSDPNLTKPGARTSMARKTPQKKSNKPSKPSALYRLFHPEPKRPKTLNEWMAQPRLDP